MKPLLYRGLSGQGNKVIFNLRQVVVYHRTCQNIRLSILHGSMACRLVHCCDGQLRGMHEEICSTCKPGMLLWNIHKSNRNAMNRNWNNQKANPALKTKTGNE